MKGRSIHLTFHFCYQNIDQPKKILRKMLLETYSDPFSFIVTTSVVGGMAFGGLVESASVVGTAAALESTGILGMSIGAAVGGIMGIDQAQLILGKQKQ